ncbi:Uncharacterized protein APZ42_006408 [Daphnia magna]|uniref:Uncharacterized protein n=1 Tax=Daphnia magna TaxID=35525 RepID=A0A164FX43_9CRUS|nr:Uncharacterized protein APZ42_006408 [Daphnia magna]
MATNPFEPVYPLNCVFLWRAPELLGLLVVEHWAFRHVFLLFQKRAYSSSGSSRDCRFGDTPTLNPPRPCLTVAASCGVLNALGRWSLRRLLLSKPTPRSSSPLTSDGCPLSVPDDRLMTPVVSASTLTMRFLSAAPSARADPCHTSRFPVTNPCVPSEFGSYDFLRCSSILSWTLETDTCGISDSRSSNSA